MPSPNLEQIDHNLHNHVVDDVTCKPPVPEFQEELIFDQVIHLFSNLSGYLYLYIYIYIYVE